MTVMSLFAYLLRWLCWSSIIVFLSTISYLTVTIIYNLKYHPYAKYPGPFLARISPLHALLHAYRGDLHLDVTRCHERYGMSTIPLCYLQVSRLTIYLGPVVRYSPNRLIFNTAEAVRGTTPLPPNSVQSTEILADIYGQGRNTQKSSGYAPHPYFPAVFNTHNCIDKEMHGRKRRIVSQGFSASAIQSSEPMIIDHVQNLCSALIRSIPEPQGLSWSPPQDMAAWSELSHSIE